MIYPRKPLLGVSYLYEGDTVLWYSQEIPSWSLLSLWRRNIFMVYAVYGFLESLNSMTRTQFCGKARTSYQECLISMKRIHFCDIPSTPILWLSYLYKGDRFLRYTQDTDSWCVLSLWKGYSSVINPRQPFLVCLTSMKQIQFCDIPRTHLRVSYLNEEDKVLWFTHYTLT